VTIDSELMGSDTAIDTLLDRETRKDDTLGECSSIIPIEIIEFVDIVRHIILA